jgi:hypothetical protein
MKKSVYILSMICFIVFYSCTGKSVSDEIGSQIPVIDLEKAFNNLSNNKMNFSEFVDDITYVPLETNENSVFGGKFLPQYNITENFIFANNMMFRRDGRFVRQLGKIGQGPGEYLLAIGIAVDEGRKEFYINDNFLHDLFVYDFDNTFVKKIKSHPQGEAIYAIGDGKLILTRTE